MGEETGASEPKSFDTTLEAFAQACADAEEGIVPEQPMVGIVLDAKDEFGADEPMSVEDDGCLRLTLRVAANDGGFIALSKTTYAPKQEVKVGDLVCWVPLKHEPSLAEQANDERFGWIGLVFATLEPEWVEDEWALREFYE